MVARGDRLDDRRASFRLDPRKENGRLHLRGRDGKLVVDRAKRRALDDERRVAVRRLDRAAHPAERLGDAFHRPSGERRVADELEPALLAGEDAGEQAHERARVPAVDRRGRRAQPVRPDTCNTQRVDVLLHDVDPERADRGDRRLRVGRASEPRDPRLAVTDGGDQDGPM